MAKVRYLLDENLHAQLRAVLQQRQPSLDVLIVGGVGGPAKGIKDPALLLWLEQIGATLVSRNRKSLPGRLAKHLAAGHHVPGIILITEAATWPEVIEGLLAIWETEEAESLQDQIRYLPLRRR